MGSYTAKTGTAADTAVLAGASEGFTPADIRQVAMAVAQSVFERTLDTGERTQPSTQDYLEAIHRTRPTVSDTMAQEFADQAIRYGRV
ncbi:hypothetical protein ACFQ1I_22130 [Kitasatospora arboriphila]